MKGHISSALSYSRHLWVPVLLTQIFPPQQVVLKRLTGSGMSYRKGLNKKIMYGVVAEEAVRKLQKWTGPAGCGKLCPLWNHLQGLCLSQRPLLRLERHPLRPCYTVTHSILKLSFHNPPWSWKPWSTFEKDVEKSTPHTPLSSELVSPSPQSLLTANPLPQSNKPTGRKQIRHQLWMRSNNVEFTGTKRQQDNKSNRCCC